NTIMLFIERSLDLLKANGLLGFVLDKQIQDVDAYESTRRLLLSNTALQQIVLSVPFPYINLDTNILISQKKLINPNRNTVIVYPRLSPEAKLSKAYTIQQQALLSHERATFTLDQSNPTLTKILNQCHPLKDVARVTTGMCVTAEDFCSNQRQDDTWHEALFGSNVSAYSIIWPSQDQISERAGRGKYICFSKDLVAKVNARFAAAQSKTIKVIGDESRFQQPKIFVRQGPGEVRLIAALDNTDKYYANQTLHIVNKKDPDYSLEFLLGYLNSTIATYVARESGLILYGEKKRPQIRTKALANLPIPVRIEIDTKSKVESFVQKIISAKSNNENEQYKYLVKELDDIFYKLFNLTPQDISHISASRS
ncbi:MAG: hypothetical protein QG658_504, partial [Patescibacteria group bacterium]|nr:hypothetical protein [Patescibacteria group bacterium]